MSEPARLGIVTTGTGPRPEYEEFHSRLLADLGLPDVEVVARHALDGLGDAEIDALAPRDDMAAIHTYVHSDDPGDRSWIGSGRREVWIDRSHFIDLAQGCMRKLGDAGVDAGILCIAEEMPGYAFSTSFPMVFPQLAMLNLVEMIARADRNTRVVSFVYGDRQREQQMAAWQRDPWMEGVTVMPVDLRQGWASAAEEASRFRPDLGLVWGYGSGLINAGDGGLEALRGGLGAPVHTAHTVATIAARNLLPPPIDPGRYVG